MSTQTARPRPARARLRLQRARGCGRYAMPVESRVKIREKQPNTNGSSR